MNELADVCELRQGPGAALESWKGGTHSRLSKGINPCISMRERHLKQGQAALLDSGGLELTPGSATLSV